MEEVKQKKEMVVYVVLLDNDYDYETNVFCVCDSIDKCIDEIIMNVESWMSHKEMVTLEKKMKKMEKWEGYKIYEQKVLSFMD